MEGSVTKIQTYESGIIFVATWGMQFLAHQDDTARAVFAAINIKKHLTKLQLDMELEDDSFVEPPVHIGIASGDVFQGVVGNFARREIVGIGETTERALHLLQTAYQHYSKIYVDVLTK
jgi:class 3 adenylate cyclase